MGEEEGEAPSVCTATPLVEVILVKPLVGVPLLLVLLVSALGLGMLSAAEHSFFGDPPKQVGCILLVLVCVGALSYLAFHRKLPVRVVEVLSLLSLLAFFLWDWSAAAWLRVRVWPVYLIILNILLLVNARRGFVIGLCSLACLCNTILAVEGGTQVFGMFDAVTSDPVCGCTRPPCLGRAAGIVHTIAEVLLGILVLALNIHLTCLFADSLREEHDRAAKSLHLAEAVADAILQFDLDLAEGLVEQAHDLPQLGDALRGLIANLRLYRPFLPHSMVSRVTPLSSPNLHHPTPTVASANVSLPHTISLPNTVTMTRVPSAPSNPYLQVAAAVNNTLSPSITIATELFAPSEADEEIDRRLRDTARDWALQMKTVTTDPEDELALHPSPPISTRALLYQRKGIVSGGSFCTHPEETLTQSGPLLPRQATVMVWNVDLAHVHSVSNLQAEIPRFAQAVVAAAQAYDGVVVHLASDKIVVAWNTHRAHPSHELQAVGCALAIASTIGAGSTATSAGQPWTSLAVATGEIYVGVVGTREHKGQVIAGGPVLAAEGIAKLARQLRARVLLTDMVYMHARPFVSARPVDAIEIGDVITVIYQAVGPLTQHGNRQAARSYAEGFSAFRQLRLADSTAAFTQCLLADPTDDQALRLLKISLLFTSRPALCEHLAGQYVRGSCEAWEDFEGLSRGTVLPDQLANHIRTKEPRCTELESVRSFGTTLLCRQIEEAQISGTARDNEGEGEEEPVSGRTSLPDIFVDNKQKRWRRSTHRLGKGASGEVFLGVGENGVLAALKFVPLPSHQSGETRRRRRRECSISGTEKVSSLVKEVQLLARLRHDNIVWYMGSGVVGHHVVVITEYMGGGSLAAMLREFSTLPSEAAVQRYTRDILAGLEFLHEKEVIHRDLKPHNVLLASDGSCKLADFGAAANLEKAGGVIGTPVYMAPEACRSACVPVSDIWSLGILVHELCVGAVPYQLPIVYPEAFMFKLQSGQLLPTLSTRLPFDVAGFVEGCLLWDCRQRPSAATLLSHPFVLK